MCWHHWPQKDEPEDVFTGLEMAMGVDWQSRVRAIVHIGDAPPHGRAFHDFQDSRSVTRHEQQLKQRQDAACGAQRCMIACVFSIVYMTIEFSYPCRCWGQSSPILF